MEIISVHWNNEGRDLHLMRGRSPALILAQRLRVISKATPTSPQADQTVVDFIGSNPSAGCTFKPSFKGTLNTGTNIYDGFGVEVHRLTGEVTAGSNPNPNPLYNFTILAKVAADRNDPASPSKKAYLRIHLHNSVAKAWLTPSPLRVPKNVTGFQFAIYAQFDDQTIAELEPTAADGTTWTSHPVDGKVNNGGFLSFDSSDVDDTSYDIRVFLTNEFVHANGAAVLVGGIAKPYTLPTVAHLIPGSAGYEKRNEVPNFLFLADGFQSGGSDQGKFNAMIDLFLKDLRQNTKFKPFDLLAGRMNFWKVFVPSTARGIGTKFEVFGPERAQPLPACPTAFDVPNDSPASESDLIDGEWGPNQVRHYFGLPVRAHMSLSNDDVRAYWKQISYLPASLIDEVSGGLINEWQKLGDRRMVNQSDTFLGTIYGGPTRAKVLESDERRLSKALFHENYQRLTRARLNQFLIGLQYRDENDVLQPIGPVWDMDIDSSTNQPRGKDFDNVIVLLGANSGRAVNIFGQMYANVIKRERDYIAIESDPAVNTGFSDGKSVKMADLAADRLPGDMPFNPGKTTLLHEIAHSLGLGDEYGESEITKEDPRLVYTGTGSIGLDREFSNLQMKSDLVVSAGADDLDAEKIKWRWHRIGKCGVLAPIAPPAQAAITQNGSQYTIHLKPGQAAVFKANEVVFLRRRRLTESLLKDVDYSQVSAPRYPFVTRSPKLSVLMVDDIVDVVVVQPVDPADLTGHDLVADFPAECILYKPLPARTVIHSFPPAGNLLELTAANVMNFIDTSGLPLHEKKDGSGKPELDFEAEQSPTLADITVALCAKKNRNVVGLYAGGMTYHHGIYHPAGHCIMRNNHQIAEFCSVCKYILTDFIDPALHPETDKLIEEYYPLKANQ